MNRFQFFFLFLLISMTSALGGELQVIITSSPPVTAVVGEAYSYDVNAVASDSAATVEYLIRDHPAGMEIDAATGLIQWTPSTAGVSRIRIKVRAEVGDGDEAEAEQEFHLQVSSNAAGSLHGVVRDTNGFGLRRIEIKVFSLSGDLELHHRTRTDSTGAYEIAGVETGTYFLKADPDDSGPGSSLDDQWFDGVHRFEDATPIVIGESTSFEANFVLAGDEDDDEDHLRFDVFGTAKDTSGNPLTGVLISARRSRRHDDHNSGPAHDGTEKEIRRGNDDIISVRTDSLGVYHLRLRSRIFIISASYPGFHPQFWNHVETKEAATPLRPVSDTSGIDFDLIPTTMTTRGQSDPATFSVVQNYPNPFNPSTTVRVVTEVPGLLRVSIFNILGQQIATLVDGVVGRGAHSAVWDAGASASGVYYYRVEFNGEYRMGRMSLMR